MVTMNRYESLWINIVFANFACERCEIYWNRDVSFRRFPQSQVCSVDHRNFPLKRSELRLQEILPGKTSDFHRISNERTASYRTVELLNSFKYYYSLKELQMTRTFLSVKKNKGDAVCLKIVYSLVYCMVLIIVFRRWTRRAIVLCFGKCDGH